MFQSSPYEGLPFVGRRRLRSFLARWDYGCWMLGGQSCSGTGQLGILRDSLRERKGSADSDQESPPWSPTHAGGTIPDTIAEDDSVWDEGVFLQDYFRSQEKAYHTLLDMVGQVSVHLNFWLDWSTPVRRRPHWAHGAARRLDAAYLTMLGQGAQISSPEKAAAWFGCVNEDLCRLVAFIQVSSFQLLSAEHNTVEDRAEALRNAIRNLACQARAIGYVAASLSLQQPEESTEAKACRKLRRWLCKRLPGQVQHWIGFDESQTVQSELLKSVKANSASLLPSHPMTPSASSGKISNNQSILDLVKDGRARLQESELALRVLVDGLSNFSNSAGRLTHFRKYVPLYCVFSVGFACFAWAKGLLSKSARMTVVRQVKEICNQFLLEWVFTPFSQFCYELLLRSPRDEVLVELRELRAEEAALERMVASFSKVAFTDPYFGAQIAEGRHVEGPDSTDLAERYFEWSMSNPISNVVNGHMLESCMVQSQKMKVLLYAALYSIDAVMTQLKWDFLMAGIMPMISLCGLGYCIISGARRKKLLISRRRMVRALAEVDRYLNHHSQALAPRCQMSGSLGSLGEQLIGDTGSADPPLTQLLLQALEGFGCSSRQSSDGLRVAVGGEAVVQFTPSAATAGSTADHWRHAHFGDSAAVELEKVGEALSHLDVLCRLATRVRLEDSDWRAFRRDILDLSSPELSVAQKLHVVSTMRGTYNVFDLSHV
eukprot:TRINITY_DN22257_c0_g1_i1.p1 TRINITY_DN22257_c0_g1~~TRINITY_DN22257_c0_g1_i1.p1  ORF type:complete len:716 (+),score=116.77 TRINITY_DN22257_c0_g1_i1:109-2256(+)